MLSQVRALNPGHYLMFSESSLAEVKALNPIIVREEPLRGLNATAKSGDKKTEAVLQVVETAELCAGDDTLVLLGKVFVKNSISALHSCNEPGFAQRHKEVVDAATAKGLVSELAKRYALNIASAGWAWRNALEADEIQVDVSWKVEGVKQAVSFHNLILSTVDTFDLTLPQYAEHAEGIKMLAEAIESALVRSVGFGTKFMVEARLGMGVGARVYPSQEWASATAKAKSKVRWPGGEGITRVLAKMKLADGESQAFINDRKVGNALRIVDTWYRTGTPGTPIAVEPYGANSHRGVALRATADDSIFGIIGQLCRETELSDEALLFYVASAVRGGVYGGKED